MDLFFTEDDLLVPGPLSLGINDKVGLVQYLVGSGCVRAEWNLL